MQQNSSANIYTVTKVIKEIQINQDLTPVWVCVGFLILFGIYILKTSHIKCEKKKLKRKDSVSPEDRPEKKNRNSWSTGPTPKQKSFLHAMGSPKPPPMPTRPPPIPRRPPPTAPPPPNTAPPPPGKAKMRVEELTQSGALDKIKRVRAAKRQKNNLRNQVMKLRQQQQSINVKTDT